MAKTETRKEILVYAAWRGLKESPALLGILYAPIISKNEQAMMAKAFRT